MQLFPGNRKDDFDAKISREIIEQSEHIGLGSSRKEKRYTDFVETMEIGDVVAIKYGGQPVALVEVAGDVYETAQVNPDLDWFPLRRQVKVLEFYNNNYNFSIPQIRGTLVKCSNMEVPTSQVIKKWHRQYLTQRSMKAIKLGDRRKEELKQLWKNFKSTEDGTVDKKLESKISDVLAEWLVYQKKINSGQIGLSDYTSRSEVKSADLPGGYLCYFLEHSTKSTFGSSKPGSSNYFEIKLNKDGETYTINEQPKSDGENLNSKAEGEIYFDKKVKPLFQNILKASTPLDKVEQIEESFYSAKHILRKVAVLEDGYNFLSIYADSAIDQLHSEFFDKSAISNLGKNYELRFLFNELFGLEDSIADNYLISRFLWRYATTAGIADEDSPNVILYGPPGTGKTYTVRKSLDFICQGDTSRYVFVPFHPSFTYEDFIEGIKPKGVSSNGNIKFELVNGIFKSFCIRAKAQPHKSFYFVVDEINRANLSSVFGETLVCLEKDYRHDVQKNKNLFKTQYSSLIKDLIEEDSMNEKLAYHYAGGEVLFGVPKNVFFIGMMNDVDKSIDAFDLALRRRFKWIRKDCDYEVILNNVKFRTGDDFSNIKDFADACKKMNLFISEQLGLGKSYEFGHSFFMKISSIANSKTISANNVAELFKLHLRPTLKEYLRAMFAETELEVKLDAALVELQKPLSKKR